MSTSCASPVRVCRKMAYYGMRPRSRSVQAQMTMFANMSTALPVIGFGHLASGALARGVTRITSLYIWPCDGSATSASCKHSQGRMSVASTRSCSRLPSPLWAMIGHWAAVTELTAPGCPARCSGRVVDEAAYILAAAALPLVMRLMRTGSAFALKWCWAPLNSREEAELRARVARFSATGCQRNTAGTSHTVRKLCDRDQGFGCAPLSEGKQGLN